ncbi:hypothetical protein NDU88_006684 [Pleurodeles waltl]|uniref:Uncharacterized protein n=1 Tax=Pleurodeles waltl TaxID=8319 RepID=A0AAV7TXS3_PLEWA|nr:hypothetical protein NDU88_006684 [Pleurodeles waltl]
MRVPVENSAFHGRTVRADGDGEDGATRFTTLATSAYLHLCVAVARKRQEWTLDPDLDGDIHRMARRRRA